MASARSVIVRFTSSSTSTAAPAAARLASLRQRVFTYVQTQWATTKGLDNRLILAKLQPALRGDILEAIYDDLVKMSPLFNKVSRECVRTHSVA